MTQAIVTIKAGISQTGLENEKRLNIIQPSARGRKFHHFVWSMPIRSGNPCRGGAGVPQTTKQPNPTIQLQPRIAILEVNLVMSFFQITIYRYLTLKTKTGVLQNTSEWQFNITSRIQLLLKNCESKYAKHEALTNSSERKAVAQKRTLKIPVVGRLPNVSQEFF